MGVGRMGEGSGGRVCRGVCNELLSYQAPISRRYRQKGSRNDDGTVIFPAHPAEAQTCLLYRGQQTLEVESIRCMPCADFLVRLLPGGALP